MSSPGRAALALVLLVGTACSSDGDDSSSESSGGAGAGTGAAAGKGGGSGAGTGGASGSGAGSGAGGASGGSGGASAGSGGSGAFPATYGLLEAEWSVIDGVTGQPYAKCEDVAVDFFRIRLRNYEEGTGWDLDASCFEGKGTFGAPAGTWDIYGQLINRDEVALAGLSADGPELTEVRAGETIVFEPFVFEMYRHRLPWTVSKGGAPSTCEAVGATQVKISWLSEDSLSVIKPCSAGITDLIPFQGARILLSAELTSSSGSVLASWELRFWELAGSGDAPPPTIAFEVP